MSQLLVDDGLSAKAMEVYRRLVDTYGYRERKVRLEPMKQLVTTMLSHRTTRKNEELAYDRMWAKYGSWDAIRTAPVDELTSLLASANYPEVKAPNIQKTLTRILADRGEYKLDFLDALPIDDGLRWLLSLPGVGVKTATLLLLFNFGKLVMPVDTHLHRVSGRLGLIPEKASAEAAHSLLLNLLPPDADVLYNFHVTMLKHGQQLCVWKYPRCGPCPLKDICRYYQSTQVKPNSLPEIPA